MTREEAIKIFNAVLFFGKCDCPKEEIEECLKMAIEALKQESCEGWRFYYRHGYAQAKLEQGAVLDKIRTEIADIYCGQYRENPLTADEVREMALEIIDKYKTEKEG